MISLLLGNKMDNFWVVSDYVMLIKHEKTIPKGSLFFQSTFFSRTSAKSKWILVTYRQEYRLKSCSGDYKKPLGATGLPLLNQAVREQRLSNFCVGFVDSNASCFLYKTLHSGPAWFHMPWDEIDSSTGCPGRKEFQREPVVSGLHPPPHLVPQPVRPVWIQHRRRTPGALLGALPAAVADPAGVALAWLTSTVPSLNLVHHDGKLYWEEKETKTICLTLCSQYCEIFICKEGMGSNKPYQEVWFLLTTSCFWHRTTSSTMNKTLNNSN